VALPAVDVDGDELAGGPGEGGLFDLGKDPPDRCGLPGPRGASEDGVSRSAPPEGRVDEVREFLQLGVAVVEVLGEVGVIEDFDIPDEGVIVMVSHRSLWGRG